MKRSEVIKRLSDHVERIVYAALAGPTDIDERAVELATALGIEVEPDDRLEMTQGSETANGYMEVGQNIAIEVSDANGLGPNKARCRALLRDLISAYNSRNEARPQWRTGVPPANGEYIVVGPLSTEVVRYDTRRGWGYAEWASSCPWMPLPSPPEK